ncbi:hypothetical protein ACWF94_14260 [Streptomyces sp. NPDC055078]
METQKPQGYGLTEPPAEPSAEPGCAICLSIVVGRSNARSLGDYSAVSDRNVELRRHRTEAHAGTNPRNRKVNHAR